jgi:hypothetical protein
MSTIMAVNGFNVHYYEPYVNLWRYEAPAYPLPANRSPSPALARSEVQPRTPRMQAPSIPAPALPLNSRRQPMPDCYSSGSSKPLKC